MGASIHNAMSSNNYNAEDYEATFGNFLKNRVTDTFNLILSHILFWVFGFRTIYMCGYTQIFTMSRWFCKQRVEFLDLAKDVENTQPYNKGLYEACQHAADVSSTPYGSLNEHGGFCSGPFGSGEFLVSFFLLIVANSVWIFKLAKFCSFPDRAENTRRIAELSMIAKQEESKSLIKDMQS